VQRRLTASLQLRAQARKLTIERLHSGRGASRGCIGSRAPRAPVSYKRGLGGMVSRLGYREMRGTSMATTRAVATWHAPLVTLIPTCFQG
jgi:hypothetical protein